MQVGGRYSVGGCYATRDDYGNVELWREERKKKWDILAASRNFPAFILKSHFQTLSEFLKEYPEMFFNYNRMSSNSFNVLLTILNTR